MMIWLFVILRIVSNPLSNVFQKILTRKSARAPFVIGVTHAILSVACIPILLWWLGPLREGFWLNILICAALAVSGNALLVHALKLGDLSVLGPINAYKSVVSLLPGVLLLNEFPRPLALAGIALIVAGSYFIAERASHRRGLHALKHFIKDPGVQFRFAALILSATEAVFLKRALLASSPIATFALWSVLGLALSLPVIAMLSPAGNFRPQARILRSNAPTCLLLGLTTGLMQLTTLITFKDLHVGSALALFQTSTLLSVILGHRIFREPHFLRRMLGATVMVAGAALIIIAAGR